jgi:hypothetical protein
LLAQESSGDQWDKTTNFEALDRFRHNFSSQGVVQTFTAHGNPPQTFWLKSAAGTLGILQITGFTVNPRGVRIRYKLVQNGNESASSQPAEFQSYAVNKTWEELSRQPNPNTPETVQATVAVGMMEDDPATILNKYVIDLMRFPPGVVKLSMTPEEKRKTAESRTLEVLVYRGELAGVIALHLVAGRQSYFNAVLGKRNGLWKILLDDNLADVQTQAEAADNFKSHAAELWNAFQKVPDVQPGLAEEAGKELATNLSAVIGPLISAAGQIQQQAATQMVTNMSAIAGSLISAAGQIQQQVASQQSGVFTINGQPMNAQSSGSKEIARLKLQLAERELADAKVRGRNGMSAPLELERAQAARDVAAAELNGDTAEVARVKLQLAQTELTVAQARLQAGLADQSEYQKAKFAYDVLVAQGKGDRLEVARLKLQLAEWEFNLTQKRFEAGLGVTRLEVEKAKIERDMAAAAYSEMKGTTTNK